MSDWIKVSDRLPSFNERILAYDGQFIYMAHRIPEKEYNEHWALDESYFEDLLGCSGAITHWTPLPESPKDT